MGDVKKISIIIPCYNELETLPEFLRRIKILSNKLKTYEMEFLFINDGSNDLTGKLLKEEAQKDKRVKVLHLARNFGHQVALAAGMDFSTGDVIITIDADLQDPPEVIEEMLDKINKGYDIVHTQRQARQGEGIFKIFTAKLFYILMQKLSSYNIITDSGDFRAINLSVLETTRNFREPHKFLRGTFANIGFKQCTIKYNREPRYAGKSNYTLQKMFNLFLNAFFSFSAAPLKFISLMIILLWSSTLIYIFKALYEHFILKITVPGWTSIIILVFFCSGLILFCLAIIGLYISRIFEQGQNHPLYWPIDSDNIDLSSEQKFFSPKEIALSKKILQIKKGNLSD